MSIQGFMRGVAWVAEGLDLADRPEGKWFKALVATGTQIHADQVRGVERTDDEIWLEVPAEVREGYQGDKKRLVADVRKTIKLLGTYSEVFKPRVP